MLVRCLLSGLLTAVGMSIIVDDEPKLFGALLSPWSSVLEHCRFDLVGRITSSFSPEDLLEFPESFYWRIPPSDSDSEIQADSPGVVDAANSSTARPKPFGHEHWGLGPGTGRHFAMAGPWMKPVT